MSQFVCPSCGAGNRIPAGKDARQAKCGKCREPVLTGGPVEVTGAQLAAHRAVTRDAAILLDVWAPWCGPCRAMAPAFEKAARELRAQARFAKVNTEDVPELARRFGVRAIPTLVLFQGGREVKRSAGVMDPRTLAAWVREAQGA